MRDMFDAGDDLGPSPFDGVDFDDEPGEDEADEEEAADEDAPRVVLGTFEDFGTRIPKSFAKLGPRPVWFLVEEHAELVGVFERFPEEASEEASSVLAFLRSFSTRYEGDLQALLGPTTHIRYGFHTSASLEEVVESFEDDGFDVLLGITDGEIELPRDIV